MELRQLEYFQRVCRFNNITRAAESLHVAQPSITNAIQKLEDELGVILLDRSKRQIKPTTEGEVFLERINNILRLVKDTTTEMRDYGLLKKGNLKIGIPPMIGTYLFPHIFVNFKNLYPQIKLSIYEKGSLETRMMIEKGDLDLGIVIISEPSKQLETMAISQSEILVCLNKTHHLCDKESLEFKDLKDEPLIMLKEGFYHRQKIMEHFKKHKISPNIVLSSNQLQTIKSLVVQGVGISFLLKEIVENDNRIVSLPLKKSMDVTIGLAWKRDRYLSNASKGFIKFITSSFGHPSIEISK
ncbi:LysR family transcriptional regulator [Wukongibacter baidiensis]|uniref:LysR family transcriptional regulator n=1 Tax=Wukongibacter baidiensis TaxID=1723361 RepID=UPI003D7F818F